MSSVVQTWLDGQCDTLDGAAAGTVFLLTGTNKSLVPAANWPRGSNGDPNLTAAAKAALERQQPIIAKVTNFNVAESTSEDGERGAATVISHPLLARGRSVGAVAVAVRGGNETLAESTLQQLSSGVAAFDRIADARTAESGSAALVLQLMASVLGHERFADAAAALATELASRLGCERVSIGVSNARFVEVVALSHSGEFSKDESLLRDLGAAMDEAVTQSALIRYPASERDQPRITLQHADLAKRHQAAQIISTPLIEGARVFGAICYEFSEERNIDHNTVRLTEDIASFVTPLLTLKHGYESMSVDRALKKAKRVAGQLVGEGHLLLKLFTLAITTAIAVLAWVPATFNVTSEARIEGAVQRTLAAPADGYLKEAYVRPGDRVQREQLLAELADEDLRLARRKWESDLAQAESAYGDALGKHDRAQIVVQQARIEQARAQIELAQQEIARSQVKAPFDGVVIQGDLSQSLGAPLKRGDQLLTLAPSDQYRVILEVDERDVALLSEGKSGKLALSSAPGQALPIKVVRVTPVARSEQGRHYFEVEAALENGPNNLLRPGLRGVAKVPAGERSLLWNWSRRAMQSLSLWYWSWFG